jgi:predicted DNA-binding protein
MTNSVKAKTATENSRKNNKIVKDVISNLTNAREDFNSAETEYQSAKHKIYNVLSVVFDQYVALKSADKAKAVRELFEKKVKELKDDQSIVATKATSLELLVLRVVIGNAFKQEREKVYARVLRLALAEKIHEDADL